MNRRTLLSSIVMACAMMVMMMLAGGDRAVAQQDPNCCHYTVKIATTIPNSCYPINLATRWNCNPVGTLVKTYTAPGPYVESIGIPPFPPCPPACTLAGVSLDNMSFIGPGETKRVEIGHCCYIVSFGFDIGGCIVITISGC